VDEREGDVLSVRQVFTNEQRGTATAVPVGLSMLVEEFEDRRKDRSNRPFDGCAEFSAFAQKDFRLSVGVKLRF
jgi:hypothetical protein